MVLDYQLEYAFLKSDNAIIQLQYNELLRKHAMLENSYDELRIKFLNKVVMLHLPLTFK